MRIAVLSDIHGNLTAFEAVLADLGQTSPDMILHGGDLADFGARLTEIVDHIRDLGWLGVIGNGEEALSRPETLEVFATQSSAPPSVWTAMREMMTVTREVLGEQRIEWLCRLPRIQVQGPMALVHASPESAWRSPGLEASDAELTSVYGPLGQSIAVYGHIHRPFIRSVPFTQRHRPACREYSNPTIRRVEYNIEQEVKALSRCGLPHSDWVVNTLRSCSPQMP